MRVVFTLPDGSNVMAPAVQVPADVGSLGASKFRMELWPDKPPAVSIAPTGVDVSDDMWDNTAPYAHVRPCLDISEAKD